MRNLFMALAVVALLLALLPPAFLYLQARAQIEDGEHQRAELAAGLFASGLTQWVQQQVTTAEMVAKDPAVADILARGDRRKAEKKAAALGYLFPDAIRVRLLQPGLDREDLSASPPITFAAVDMIRQAETKETPPPLEVHGAGTPQEHVNLVRRVLDRAGKHIVGHLMVSFSMQPLHRLLTAPAVPGYAELQQSTLVVDSRGDAALKQGAPAGTASIPGSRWRVAYWPSAAAAAATSKLLLGTLVALGALALVILAAALLLYRRVAAALRSDQATLLSIVKDMRDGRKGEYAATLAELHDTVELMARTASAGAARPVAVEKSGDKETAPVVDEVEADLLFDQDALDIEKVQVDESRIDPSIFRAYDIRGVVDASLTPEAVFEIGRAIGSEAYYRGEQTVVVGRDGRLSGPDLADALIRGLRSTGRDVKDIGQVPTPVLYFAAQYLGANSGVMVTGSHNPPEYNGLKIVLGGETLASEAIQDLRRRIEEGDLLTGDGSVETIDVLPDYLERIKSDVQVVRPLKVVVDCGNGVAGVAAPQLLKELGCEVVELFCEVDGNFPNHHPDPSKPDNLAPLIAAVREHGADLGLAFDGDGDRLGVVTSEGEIIWPDRLMMLFAMDVLSRNPGAQIIYDVKCSRHLAAIISEHGGEPLMWCTGHSLVKAKMKETGALLAGEMSGHIFFKERWYGFDDALYSAARLLEILANDHRSSSEVFAELPDSINTPELNVAMAEGEPSVFMEKLLNSAHFEDAQVATIDGLRVEFDHGWGLVRASNTTPCLVLRFEADDELALHRIQEEFRRVMLQADPDLALPF
ncbi:MAG TPA: phosphomannomutase/phosphoglucomutase [Gammaproteobacteria bacterium]|nr:phosphomannomutase/phosphoglucomutase [Gammaproteobacteria bacterium]